MVDPRRRRNMLLGSPPVPAGQYIPEDVNYTYIQSGGTGSINDWTSSGDAPAWQTSAPLPSGRASYLRFHKAASSIYATHDILSARVAPLGYDTVDGIYMKIRLNATNGQYGVAMPCVWIKGPAGEQRALQLFSETDITASCLVRFHNGITWVNSSSYTSTGGNLSGSYHNWAELYIVGYTMWARYWRDNTTAPAWALNNYDLKTIILADQRYMPSSIIVTGMSLVTQYTTDPYVGVSDVQIQFDVTAPV